MITNIIALVEEQKHFHRDISFHPLYTAALEMEISMLMDIKGDKLLHDDLLIVGVQSGCSFVKKDKFWIFVDRSSD